MRKILNILLNCWFPRTCCACHRNLDRETLGLCFYCKQFLQETAHFKNKNNSLFLQLEFRIDVYSIQALYFFQPKSIEQRAIHDLKYGKNREIGNFFGKEMGKKILHTDWLKDIDCIVPIPLHKTKERIRGYNQALVLCEGISEESGIRIAQVLKKSSAGKGATKGNRMERMNARKLDFEMAMEIPLNVQHVLIVDDVITTGATLESAYHTLRRNFNGKISVISIAHTI